MSRACEPSETTADRFVLSRHPLLRAFMATVCIHTTSIGASLPPCVHRTGRRCAFSHRSEDTWVGSAPEACAPLGDATTRR